MKTLHFVLLLVPLFMLDAFSEAHDELSAREQTLDDESHRANANKGFLRALQEKCGSSGIILPCNKNQYCANNGGKCQYCGKRFHSYSK